MGTHNCIASESSRLHRLFNGDSMTMTKWEIATKIGKRPGARNRASSDEGDRQ